MRYRIAEVAAALGAEAVGDLTIEISGLAEPALAGKGHLALAMEPSYGPQIAQGSAIAAVLWPGADWQALGLRAAIFAPRSRYVMAGMTRVFERKPVIAPGIHVSAIIADTASIGKNAAIGPFVVIGEGVRIGANARILSHCTISEGAEIGDDALLYQSVHIGAFVTIGNGFIAQAGAVVGADGFSYVTPKPGAVEEAKASGQVTEASRTDGFARINSLGGVVLGNNVEMGGNSVIDRGTVADTCVGNGTKIDNLVHIGHNVRIGRHCLICGQVGIAGSSVVGDRVILGGQVGVADHVTIGSDVIAAGKSGISSHVPPGRVVMGNPAMRMDLNVEAYKALRRLPRLVAKVENLQKRVSKTDPKA